MVEREIKALEWGVAQERKERVHKVEILSLNQKERKLESEIKIAQYELDQEELCFCTIATKLDHQTERLQLEIDHVTAQRAWYEAERQRSSYTDTTPT